MCGSGAFYSQSILRTWTEASLGLGQAQWGLAALCLVHPTAIHIPRVDVDRHLYALCWCRPPFICHMLLMAP